jgi:hypothetical protein
MVTQVTEPAALDLKTLAVTVPPVPIGRRVYMNQSQNPALSQGPDGGIAFK